MGRNRADEDRGPMRGEGAEVGQEKDEGQGRHIVEDRRKVGGDNIKSWSHLVIQLIIEDTFFNVMPKSRVNQYYHRVRTWGNIPPLYDMIY